MEEKKSIQPFKTISLVDKLKGSIYDKDFKGTAKQNNPQGSPEVNTIPLSENKDSSKINLPKSQLTLPREGVVLKGLPTPETKESVILKGLADGPQAQYPTPQPLKFIPLSATNIPSARTRFASTVSLVDRLKQPSGDLGNPPNTVGLPTYFLSDLYTGYLNISRFLTSPIDSIQNIINLELPISVSSILAGQDPNTQLTTPLEDSTILIGQGTVFNNGNFESLIQKEARESNDTILQLQGTFFSNNEFISLVQLETPIATINQGEVNLPIWNYVNEQGGTLSVTIPEGDIQIAVLQGMVVSNGIIIGSLIEPSKLQTISLQNSTIPSLDILAYQTDRLLAFAAPKIKHGSGLIEVTRHDGDKQKSQQSPESKHGAAEGLSKPTLPKDKDEIAVGNNKTLIPLLPSPQITAFEESDTVTPTPFPRIVGDGFLKASIKQFTPVEYNVKEAEEGNLKRYGITAFQTSESNLPATHYINALPITFTPEGGKPIKVPCYLTSFSDGFGASWNDVNYVGRQDTLKQFKGVTRALSFALLVPSFSKAELKANMAMLNKLADATVIGTMSGKYVKGPLCKLKIGNLINSYCAFSSMKWDFDPAEATMDIDEHLPHMLKVSFDAAVLADRNDKLLGSKSGDYFGSIY